MASCSFSGATGVTTEKQLCEGNADWLCLSHHTHCLFSTFSKSGRIPWTLTAEHGNCGDRVGEGEHSCQEDRAAFLACCTRACALTPPVQRQTREKSPSAVSRHAALQDRSFGLMIEIPNNEAIHSILKPTGDRERETERSLNCWWTSCTGLDGSPELVHNSKVGQPLVPCPAPRSKGQKNFPASPQSSKGTLPIPPPPWCPWRTLPPLHRHKTQTAPLGGRPGDHFLHLYWPKGLGRISQDISTTC